MDDDDPPDWLTGPEAKMWDDRAKEEARWEAQCARQIDTLWRSLPPVAWPGIARYQHLQRWVVVKRFDLKRWH